MRQTAQFEDDVAGLAVQIHSRLQTVEPLSNEIVSASSQLVGQIASDLLHLLGGGLLGAVYFPITGYLEFSLMNYQQSAQGQTPEEQQEYLMQLVERPVFQRLYPKLMTGYGSIYLANGVVSLTVLCDGSYVNWVEHLDLPLAELASPHATIILQLPPLLTEPSLLATEERTSLIIQSLLHSTSMLSQ